MRKNRPGWRVFVATAALPLGAAASQDFPDWMQVGSRQPLAHAEREYRDLMASLYPGRPPKFESTQRGIYTVGHPGDTSWHFYAPVGATSPESAFHVREPQEPPYRVAIDRYCEPKSCDQLDDRIRKFKAPGVRHEGPLKSQWRKIVATEICDLSLRDRVRHPAMPVDEYESGTEGDVIVAAFHNRCGTIRDAVVASSSGNANLDNRARMAVGSWRIRPSPPFTSGWRYLTVRFRVSDPANIQHESRRAPAAAADGIVQDPKR
jgi:TonB family protein